MVDCGWCGGGWNSDWVGGETDGLGRGGRSKAVEDLMVGAATIIVVLEISEVDHVS